MNVDTDWSHEYELAQHYKMGIQLIDYDVYKTTRLPKSITTSSLPTNLQSIIYRGWMMPVEVYTQLYPVGIHPKSNMPLTEEYRIFVLNNQPITCGEYWNEGNYTSLEAVNYSQFTEIFATVNSKFFTVDIARKKNGD